ncbi:hypothetical protein BDY21DRAFT_358009 [Lineolata rhizophorae]|uniref:CHY-type domain-containing protein n=1 Tax=Lineolata rhizophorae TaxID=578093 RepID=A0A6A6NM31_9PEZI|nr:hypothetical protein BDY21DRAFT_358009 [Lineolata rhizophorae]
MYDLEPCRVEIVGVEGPGGVEAREGVERAFAARAEDRRDLSLVNHVNWLAQNMHALVVQEGGGGAQARARVDGPGAVEPGAEPGAIVLEKDGGEPAAKEEKEARDEYYYATDLPSRSHIIKIPRPPEWSAGDDDGGDDSSDLTDSYSEDDDEAEEQEDDAQRQNQTSMTSLAERGIMISLPFLELHGIELLELVSPSVTVKCDRCKTTMDVSSLKNNTSASSSGMRTESCKKCANPFGIGYRMDMMHANSVRAGYLDLDGCTVVDLLPSAFVPTCSECSTPASSVAAVRGDAAMAICRECHRRMNFHIPEVKFLLVNTSTGGAKEKLGIVAGHELPKRGRCAHYSKSYRWFRCHDETESHPNEHANRMICSSREQNYRPEDCAICHATLVGKRGTGFWEGGKGKAGLDWLRLFFSCHSEFFLTAM